MAGGVLCHNGTEQTPTTECQGTVSRPSAVWTRGVESLSEKLHHHSVAIVYPVYDSDVHDGTATRLNVAEVV